MKAVGAAHLEGTVFPRPGEPRAHFPEPPGHHPGRPRPANHLAPLSGHAGPGRPVPGLCRLHGAK